MHLYRYKCTCTCTCSDIQSSPRHVTWPTACFGPLMSGAVYTCTVQSPGMTSLGCQCRWPRCPAPHLAVVKSAAISSPDIVLMNYSLSVAVCTRQGVYPPLPKRGGHTIGGISHPLPHLPHLPSPSLLLLPPSKDTVLSLQGSPCWQLLALSPLLTHWT